MVGERGVAAEVLIHAETVHKQWNEKLSNVDCKKKIGNKMNGQLLRDRLTGSTLLSFFLMEENVLQALCVKQK